MVICASIYPFSRSQAASSIPNYYVEKPTVAVNISHEIESEKRSGEFINLDKDTSTSKQQFDIRTRGWVYHPALMIFSVGLNPEFKQQDINVNTGTARDDDATFLGYFLDTTLLQRKPYTVNLYASQDRSDFSNSLAPDSATESSIYRGQLSLKYQPLPTTITLESKDRMTESFFLTREKSEKLRIDSKHKTLMTKTRLEAEILDRNRNIRGTEISGERKFMYLSNHYRFGEKNSLSSGLRFTDNTSGAVDSETAFISSQLSVHNTENLKTHYQVRIEDRDEGGFTSTKKFAAARLTHQLYENLTTVLNGDVDNNEFTEGSLDAYGAGIDLRYARKIPWGKLNINLGHRERIEDDQRQLAFAEVRDESHVLTGTDLVLLANGAIDVSSIVVTDLGGLPYAINTDYIVTAVGNSVFISRNSVGGITDGDEVLVDYSFQADPPAKIETVTDTFDVYLDLWTMLRFYYQQNQSSEKFISGIEPSELTDDTVQRTGVEFNWKWSTTKIETEDRDTTRTPTKRFRVSERLTFRPKRNISFGFMADYNKLELIDTDEQSEGTGVFMNLQWDLGRAGQLSADGFNQKITGSAQRSDRKGMKILYQWKYGVWRPSLRYAFVDELDEIARESRKRNNIYFEISRKFQ